MSAGAHNTPVVLMHSGKRCHCMTRAVPPALCAHVARCVPCALTFAYPARLCDPGIGPAKHLASLGIPQVADLPVGLNLSVRRRCSVECDPPLLWPYTLCVSGHCARVGPRDGVPHVCLQDGRRTALLQVPPEDARQYLPREWRRYVPVHVSSAEARSCGCAGYGARLIPFPLVFVLAPPQYLCFGSGVLQSNLLQGTAFYHSELPKHTLDSAPDAPDTQIHFIPTTGNENAWEKVRASMPSVLAVWGWVSAAGRVAPSNFSPISAHPPHHRHPSPCVWLRPATRRASSTAAATFAQVPSHVAESSSSLSSCALCPGTPAPHSA